MSSVASWGSSFLIGKLISLFILLSLCFNNCGKIVILMSKAGHEPEAKKLFKLIFFSAQN